MPSDRAFVEVMEDEARSLDTRLEERAFLVGRRLRLLAARRRAIAEAILVYQQFPEKEGNNDEGSSTIPGRDSHETTAQ